MKNISHKLFLHPVFLPVILSIVLQSAAVRQYYGDNILPNMKDGLQDEVILSLYEEEIDNVYTWTTSKTIHIWLYDCDLNGDGFTDKIVIIASPLHSGSHGDTFEIWLGGGGNSYTKVQTGLTIMVINQNEWPKLSDIGSVNILPSKSNDCFDIELKSPLYHILLKYDGTQYQTNFLHLQSQIGEAS